MSEQDINETGTGAGEPVLTDDEKNALLDGVASGAVEVQSASGPHYASVTPYVISARARLKSNSMPRLDNLNDQIAKKLAENCSSMLQADFESVFRATRNQPFGDFCESWPARSVAISFTASPLSGTALIVIDSVMIGPLVETFFGGNSPESIAHNQAAHSPGSLSIVQLLALELLGIVREVWEPLKPLTPNREKMKIGLDMVDAIGAGDRVIVSEFEVAIGENGKERGTFCIVWPEASLAPLRAALSGDARERDPAEDTRWHKILRKRLPEVVVGLDSTIGHVRMTLADVMRWQKGDVIGIETPRIATVRARGIPLLEGRFGVQAGRNAIETVAWLDPQIRTH